MSKDPRPCASGIRNHTPEPAERDRHHLFPKYLAALLGVSERTETVLLCSGCHDLLHHVLHHRINSGIVDGHRLTPALRGMVDDAWRWWVNTSLKEGTS